MRRLLADSDEQVFEFLNIVDIATRSNICFPVPSKRLDDVLCVLEMVWVNWAGPMNHLISDMGGEFEGERGEFMEACGIRPYFTVSEANDFLSATSESGKRVPENALFEKALNGEWQ